MSFRLEECTISFFYGHPFFTSIKHCNLRCILNSREHVSSYIVPPFPVSDLCLKLSQQHSALLYSGSDHLFHKDTEKQLVSCEYCNLTSQRDMPTASSDNKQWHKPHFQSVHIFFCCREFSRDILNESLNAFFIMLAENPTDHIITCSHVAYNYKYNYSNVRDSYFRTTLNIELLTTQCHQY